MYQDLMAKGLRPGSGAGSGLAVLAFCVFGFWSSFIERFFPWVSGVPGSRLRFLLWGLGLAVWGDSKLPEFEAEIRPVACNFGFKACEFGQTKPETEVQTDQSDRSDRNSHTLNLQHETLKIAMLDPKSHGFHIVC